VLGVPLEGGGLGCACRALWAEFVGRRTKLDSECSDNGRRSLKIGLKACCSAPSVEPLPSKMSSSPIKNTALATSIKNK